MKQDIVEYMIDSFVDFNGVERKIVACALSQSPETDDEFELSVAWVNKFGNADITDPLFAKVYRMVTIGIAICNPSDTYDEELGKTRAYNKALNDPKCPTLFTKDKGVIGKILVKAFLKQEIEFTKENPERIIKGYNQKKEGFDKKEKIKNEIKNLTETERYVVNLAQEGVDIVKCAELAKKAKTVGIKLNEQD